MTGSAVAWLRDNVKRLDHVAESSAFAMESKDDQVVVVPSFQGLAAPYWETDVRCAMFGISRSSSAEDIVRATLDGIAMRIVELVTAMCADVGKPPERLKVDGGPTHNTFLMQRIADLLQIEVHVSSNTEATAIGIANLARTSVFGTTTQQLSKEWKVKQVFTPSMDETTRSNIFSRWKRAIGAVQHYHS